MLFNKNLKEEEKIALYQEKVLENEKKRSEMEIDLKIEQDKKIQKYKEKEEKIQQILQCNAKIAEDIKSKLTIKLNKT